MLSAIPEEIHQFIMARPSRLAHDTSEDHLSTDDRLGSSEASIHPGSVIGSEGLNHGDHADRDPDVEAANISAILSSVSFIGFRSYHLIGCAVVH